MLEVQHVRKLNHILSKYCTGWTRPSRGCSPTWKTDWDSDRSWRKFWLSQTSPSIITTFRYFLDLFIGCVSCLKASTSRKSSTRWPLLISVASLLIGCGRGLWTYLIFSGNPAWPPWPLDAFPIRPRGWTAGGEAAAPMTTRQSQPSWCVVPWAQVNMCGGLSLWDGIRGLCVFFFLLFFGGLNLQPTERRAGIFGMNLET